MQADPGIPVGRPSSAMGRFCENVGQNAQKPPLPLAESVEKYRESLRKYEIPTDNTSLKGPTKPVSPNFSKPRCRCASYCNENMPPVPPIITRKVSEDDITAISNRLNGHKTCGSGGLCSRARSGSLDHLAGHKQPQPSRLLVRPVNNGSLDVTNSTEGSSSLA